VYIAECFCVFLCLDIAIRFRGHILVRPCSFPGAKFLGRCAWLSYRDVDTTLRYIEIDFLV